MEASSGSNWVNGDYESNLMKISVKVVEKSGIVGQDLVILIFLHFEGIEGRFWAAAIF